MIFFTSTRLIVAIVAFVQLVTVSNVIPSIDASPVPRQALAQDSNIEYTHDVSLDRRFIPNFTNGAMNKAKEYAKKAPGTIRKKIHKNSKQVAGAAPVANMAGDFVTKISEEKLQNVAHECSKENASIDCIKA
ncbi:hypothetical protein BDF22DRAFT_653064 [Syncephalis plumigaleata]|nr:hypothetical protein BDF22DRAFT_653064 [Syncephalis plumigaleata]